MTTTSDNKFSAASSAVSILLGVELKAYESSGFLPPKGHQDELFRSRLESEDWPSTILSALSFSGVGVDLPEKQTNIELYEIVSTYIFKPQHEYNLNFKT